MNSFTLLNLVLNPEKAKEADLEQLEELVEEHPYFQAGRLLIAKITKESEHIKTAAAYTSERSVLMDVINSKFNRDVNLPNIDNLEIGSDDLGLFDKIGKEDDDSKNTISADTTFDEAFPEISFEDEQTTTVEEDGIVKSEPEEEIADSDSPPAIPNLDLPALENEEESTEMPQEIEETSEIEEKTIDELTEELPSLDLPSFEQTEDSTNLTEKSIDDILREMNITSDDSENDGIIDSDEIAEFKLLRAEAEKSRLAAMEAMEAEEKKEKEEEEASKIEEVNEKTSLPDVEDYELPDYKSPEDNLEEFEESKPENDTKKESKLFDNEDTFFETKDTGAVSEEIELEIEKPNEETDDKDDFFEPKKSIFDVDDSLFSLDALLEQSVAQVDPLKELEKQPALHTKDAEKKDIQNEQVGLIDNFIVNAPSLRISKDKIDEDEQENDLSEEQLRSQATPISENLATIMIKQQKFKKAVEIYEQLILKFPHKKAYFAKLIENLKNR